MNKAILILVILIILLSIFLLYKIKYTNPAAQIYKATQEVSDEALDKAIEMEKETSKVAEDALRSIENGK